MTIAVNLGSCPTVAFDISSVGSWQPACPVLHFEEDICQSYDMAYCIT